MDTENPLVHPIDMFSDSGCSTPCLFESVTPGLLCSSEQDLPENGDGHLRKLYRFCCCSTEVYMNLCQRCEVLNRVTRHCRPGFRIGLGSAPTVCS